MGEPDGAVVRRHVRVTGRVQGVAFRASTRQEADRLGLVGWARNRPDGSVEAALQGPEAAVEELLRWMRHGPGAARVDAVDVTVVPPETDDAFRVR